MAAVEGRGALAVGDGASTLKGQWHDQSNWVDGDRHQAPSSQLMDLVSGRKSGSDCAQVRVDADVAGAGGDAAVDSDPA